MILIIHRPNDPAIQGFVFMSKRYTFNAKVYTQQTGYIAIRIKL